MKKRITNKKQRARGKSKRASRHRKTTRQQMSESELITPVRSISTYSVHGKVQMATEGYQGLYSVFGLVSGIKAAEGRGGINIALRGQFGAFRWVGDVREEFRAPKAYLPEKLTQDIVAAFKALPKKAELEIFYEIGAVPAQGMLGYEYSWTRLHNGRSDPFSTVREIALSQQVQSHGPR